MNVMVVDDEPLEREVLTLIIKRENLEISTLLEANNGAIAVDIAKQTKLDVVLMDIKMPVMDGLAAGRIIKKRMPECRIIYLTAYNEYETLQRSIVADDYLLKPAHPNDLKQVLNKYIPMVNNHENPDLATSLEHEAIRTVKEHIENHLHTDITLDALSGLVYLNSQYLSRLFKHETGTTITQYITIRRLERAKQFLKYNRDTVMEISEKCGFTDPNYFTRVFKKYVGITPTHFQQNALQERKKRINAHNNFIM